MTAPAGGTTGDRLYVIVDHNSETTTCVDNNGATPTTEQGEYQGAGGSGGFAVYYRDIGGSEPGSYAYTLSGSQRWAVVAFTLRGMHASNAFSVVPAFGTNESSTAPTCPGITTLTANECVVAVAAIDGPFDGVFTAGPSGFTEIQTETGQQPTSVYYKVFASAGATGDQDFTKTSAGGNNNYTLTLFSIEEAAGGVAAPDRNWTLLLLGVA